MSRYSSANDILNRVALEVGLLPSSNAVADTDESFIQLTGLLTGAGQELVEYHPWQRLRSQFDYTTKSNDTPDFDLPDDFAYMIDQTGWELSNTQPLGGPLSAQDWTYFKGRDLVGSTILVFFRMMEGKFYINNDPVPAGLRITFDYISRNWVEEAGGANDRKSYIDQGTDVVLYEPVLIVKFLKAKFLESKGFDAAPARLEFENMMNSRMGKDEGAKVLNAARSGSGHPYITPYRNARDTGYGLS